MCENRYQVVAVLAEFTIVTHDQEFLTFDRVKLSHICHIPTFNIGFWLGKQI